MTQTVESKPLITKVGKLTHAFLGFEDHGIFSFNLAFDFGGTGQGTGHYNINGPVGGPLIKAILETLGAHEWKDLDGTIVYVLYAEDDWNASIVGVQALPFSPGSGKPLIFKEFFEKTLQEQARDEMRKEAK